MFVNKLTDDKANIAFKTNACVFVAANAGSGKTSLLANRVLSLLVHGVEPARILCLTFTNAAAAEMSSRILKSLGSWVMMDEEKLGQQIGKLTGGNVTNSLLENARSLFARVLESSQGINIQTIHGFSQSLLKRFPLEAGISPHFSVMDSRSEQEALSEARLRLFNNARKSDSTIQKSLDNLAREVSESSFHKLMGEIVGNKNQFRQVLQDMTSIPAIEHSLYQLFKIGHGTNIESLLLEFFSYDEEQLIKFRAITELLLRSEKVTDKKTAEQLNKWLVEPEARVKPDSYEAYITCYITDKGEARKIIFTKDALIDAGLIDELLAEQKRVCEFAGKLRALSVVQHSMDVMAVAEALLAEYEAIKRGHAWMDYDDLISTACELLTRAGMSPWVLFKLDGGIDHILVDEAQGASPQQWMIINALTQEFFAGQGANEGERSLFIVGDEKQSIFSFQGANVKELARMQKYFAELITAAQKTMHYLSLTKSYRSTTQVLRTVDAVFARQETRYGVMSEDVELNHILTRIGHDGLVELWPLVRTEEESEFSPVTRLVRLIADKIQGWIESGEAQAGDIMILLRSRTQLADRLVRALKRRGVPVAGSDRMALNDNLAVQDLIAFGQVMLLPEDELTLAACLKSPIFDFSEDDLFMLAHDRGGKTLWQCLAESPRFADSYELLAEMRAKADFVPPFELYSYLLDTKGIRRRFIGRMGEEYADPIDEFMQQTLLYERSHPPSLQGFIHWLVGSNSMIKRDMEQARNAVRIMTVHGSKGLQSKIIILPDTIEIPQDRDSLLWLDNIPLRSLSSKKDDQICRDLRRAEREEMLSEYRRLLYVALTRAEDRLFIFGATGKEKISEQSWYHHIKTGIETIAEGFETPLGQGLRVGDVAACHPALVAGSGNRADIGAYGTSSPRKAGMTDFLQKPVPVEPSPSKPLTPSRIVADVPASVSPLSKKHVYATGKLIHLLLQYLPEQEPAKRDDLARFIARKFNAELPEKSTEKPRSNRRKVTEKPDFAIWFGKDILAEVPITGNIEIDGNNITISGQIDRLYVGKDEVWIVDFKSNQSPPDAQRDIPTAYIRQLALYRMLLAKIYPDKTVYCALLWTENAKFDVLHDALLDEVKLTTYI
mgnify:CR=1 FL=1